MSEVNSAQVPNVGAVAAREVAATPVMAKSKSPVGVIVALVAVVVLLLIGAVVVVLLGQNGSKSGRVLADHDTSQMGKADGKAYTFYYPKGFTKSVALSADAEGIVQNYSSSVKNANGGANSINLVYTKEEADIKGQSDCDLGGASLASTYATQLKLSKDAIKSEKSEFFTKGAMVGCDFTFSVTIAGQTMTIQQLMFAKSGVNGTHAITLTSDNTAGAEYTSMRDAAESFKLK